MKTPVRYPQGPCWPEQMQADMAAAFCDEPSVEAFRKKVGIVYPEGMKRCGRTKWHIEVLRRSLAEIHDLELYDHNEIENISDLI